ncbi:hypothetical protein AGMMS50239_02970 [Bacteroidia bacterium]|nr:hypothetical protein AGMMS50239_02970 [Bacteroidia bacterium]
MENKVYDFKMIINWILFFLNALKNIQSQLMIKLEQSGSVSQLSPKEKSIITIIQNYSGIKSVEIAKKLFIPNPTVKRILSDLQTKSLIEKQGSGRGRKVGKCIIRRATAIIRFCDLCLRS